MTRESLHTRLQDGMEATLEERLEIALQVARIVRGWHRMGRYHGDLRAAWIQMEPDGTVMVLAGAGVAGPESERADVRGFGKLLGELLRGEAARGQAEAGQPDAMDVPPQLIALWKQVTGGEVGMREVVQVLEQQLRRNRAQAVPWWENQAATYPVMLLGAVTMGGLLLWMLAT